jgi:hypothetical protein
LLVAGEIAFFPQQVIIKSFGFGLIFCYFLAVQSPVANVFLHFQVLSGAASQNKYLLAMPTWIEYTARATFE